MIRVGLTCRNPFIFFHKEGTKTIYWRSTMRMAMTRANTVVASNEEGDFATRLLQHMLLPGFWGRAIAMRICFWRLKGR